jgi:hypothetical protein
MRAELPPARVSAGRRDADNQRRGTQARHPRLLDLPWRHRDAIAGEATEPTPAEARAHMLRPEDLAAYVMLVATLPSRAVVEEMTVQPR